MRLNILAFAAGVLWLQFQPALPAWWLWAAAGGTFLLLPAACWRRTRVPLAFVASLLIGLSYATWRAEMRLAEQLPTAWEGRCLLYTSRCV